MRTLLLAFIVLGGCGESDVAPGAPPDASAAPAGAAPTVTVSSPRANEAYYVDQIAEVEWLATDDDDPALSCDVVAVDGATTIPIATGVATMSGQVATFSWTLTAVPVSPSYRVEVTCQDASAQTATAMSELFAIAGPPQQVSFAAQILPLLERCDGGMCHDPDAPKAGLDLSPTAAHASLVGVTSSQCTTTALVDVGSPSASYLVHKLQGSGPCFMNMRMPRGGTPLTADELQLVRDWIATGAQDN